MAVSLRFRVDPRDVPPTIAGRRLGLTLAEFEKLLPRLLSRGFPTPDLDTGNFDLDAIDEWRRRRHRNLYPGLTADACPEDARARISDRLREARQRGIG